MPATLSKSSIPRISFNELVSGSEGVRYTDVNSVPYMSVRDIIMVVCNTDSKNASKIWGRISNGETSDELSSFWRNFKFEGRGQSEQPVITLQGAIKLIMWLPGNMAKDFRSQACDILTRYLAGDQSLHAEVNANAASDAPINEFARASLPDSTRDNALIELLTNANAQAAANAAQLIIANAKQAELFAEHIRANAKQAELFAEHIRAAGADLEKERHLRHQADGRYGSGIREATKEVRKRAADSDARAVAAEERAAEDRRAHLQGVRDAAERASEDQRLAAEERRAAAASHQLLAETLSKLAARIV